MYKIGITGGICSGKSQVLSVFRELGAYTISADELARKILFENSASLLKEIGTKVGGVIFDDQGQFVPKKMAEILFSSPKKRAFINQIIHPKVREERNRIVNSIEETKLYDFLFYESALLVESGMSGDFDRLIVVYSNPEIQLKRLMERDMIDQSAAKKRIKSQFPLSEKLKVAHYTIDTSGTIANTCSNTLETFSLIKRDFKIK